MSGDVPPRGGSPANTLPLLFMHLAAAIQGFMPFGPLLLAAAAAYLLGSLPTGFLVARARGIDIRAQGSGNIGATNVFRILGIPAGIFVLLTDALKGAVAVLLVPTLVAQGFPGSDPVSLRMTCALGAVLGHNYTCWLRFKGGKGIATSAGALAALVPEAFLITLGVFLLVLAVSRYVSLASISGAAALPVAAWMTQAPRAVFWLSLLLALLAIGKHHSNIRRLLAGTESRLGTRPHQPRPTNSDPIN